MKSSSNAITLRHVTKVYAGSKKRTPVTAVNNLNLDVKSGEILALLGPNGAGKTTTIGMLVGTVKKTSGDITVMGHDVEKDYKITRSLIGVVPQEVNFDPFATVRKTLEYQSGLFGVEKKDWWIDEILETLQLREHADKNTRALSGGMKRRLLIAKALVHRPKILILDEPTAGVDIELRHRLWTFVRKLNKAGTTVILTTHYLEEAEELADRIAIIDQGELKAFETLAELKSKHGASKLEAIYMKLVHNHLIA